MPTEIFINYRQDDTSSFAEYLRSRLEAEMVHGSIFLDKESIDYGQGISGAIRSRLQEARFLLVVAGPQWKDVKDDEGDRRLLHPEDWVRKEIEFAQEKGKTILLVLFDQDDFKHTASWLSTKVPSLAFLGDKKYFHCTAASQRQDVKLVLDFLRTQPELSFKATPEVSSSEPLTDRQILDQEFPLATGSNGNPIYQIPDSPAPFMGLAYFRKEDTRLFFGRTADTLTLCRAIRRFPLVLLHGHSGVGKSSLLHAGLLPRLEHHYHQTSYVRRAKQDDTSGEALGLHRQLHRLLEDSVAAERPTLLILDQVEEMYTNPLPKRREELEGFAQSLQQLNSTFPHVKVLLSFRSEHYAPIRKLITSQGILLTEDQQCYLEALDEAGMREAIGGMVDCPDLCGHYQLQLDPALVEAMTRDLWQQDHPESHVAPLLQYQLRKLWDDALARRTRDHETIHMELAAYQQQKKDSLTALLDEQLVELVKRRPAWQTYLDNGLIWDLLQSYVTDRQTAKEEEDKSVSAHYAHISGFAALFAELKHHSYLMIPCGTAQRPATRLAHDTFAPLVVARYRASDAAGQRARRIIETKARELRAGIRPAFSETDIEAIESGRMGTQQLDSHLEALMAADAQRYQKEREDRFRLALTRAAEDIEHLRFAKALTNLQLAHTESIRPKYILALARYLAYPLMELQDTSLFPAYRELLQELAPGLALPTSLSELSASFRSKAPRLYERMQRAFYPEMIEVEGGTFQMGSEEGYEDEKPVHTVTISDFALATTPITCWQFGLYRHLTQQDLPRDSGFGRGQRPVVNVSWYEAIDYCNWLSERKGLEPVYERKGGNAVLAHWERNGYRLPTEAEWEYAAQAGRDKAGIPRGGQGIRFGNGQLIARPEEMNYNYAHPLNDKAYIEQTERRGLGQTTPVKRFAPNLLGFYDLSGNVNEWCWDRWSEGDYYRASEGATDPRGPTDPSETRRMVRGGSWFVSAILCRSSYRYWDLPIDPNNFVGFRVVRRLTL